MKIALYTLKNTSDCIVIYFQNEEELNQSDEYVYGKYTGEAISERLLALFWEDIDYIIEENNYRIIEDNYIEDIRKDIK